MRIARSHVLVGIDDHTLLAGARAVLEAFKEEVEKRGLSDEIKVVETGSFGIYDRGVIVGIFPERVFYGDVTVGDVREIVEEHLLKGRPVSRLLLEEEPRRRRVSAAKRVGLVKEQPRIVLENCGRIDPESIDEYIAAGGFEALEKALTSMTPEQVIDEVELSQLRGRGGAGFPTGMKWRFAARAKGEEKFIICNADEGEPGTFKDRLIMEGDPHRIVEAMTIAGYAVGANKGYIYIRGEYPLSIQRLSKAIENARSYGLLGKNILGSGFSFDIEIKKGAGAYVCGEETALIESLEGKRGHPRNKPPFPVTEGLWRKPTVVNNVETLANIPPIIKKGAAWFRSFGPVGNTGTKVFTLLGDVVEPGSVEVEMGTPLSELIFEYGGGIKGGRKFKAALIGGAAGAFIGQELIDIHLDYDSMREFGAVLGSGAILVMSDRACIVDMLRSVLLFFRHESCGKCAPCRIGTDRLVRLIELIACGKGRRKHIEIMKEIVEAMRTSSFCPLGQSVYTPVSSALRFFEEEIYEHVEQKKCRAGVCKMH